MSLIGDSAAGGLGIIRESLGQINPGARTQVKSTLNYTSDFQKIGRIPSGGVVWAEGSL